MFGSGSSPLELAKQTTLIILNAETNDIMKIVKSLEKSGLLIKRFSKTIQNKVKEKRRISQYVLGLIGASLLGNLLTVKGRVRAGKDTGRAGLNFQWCLILFKILKYKTIIKINLNLMVFIQEIINLKKRMGHMK